jgi:tripartite-type tricarboxylate transporter receptor subunit TctC
VPDRVEVRIAALEAAKRPVNAVADNVEFKSVVEVVVAQDKKAESLIMFDPDHSWDERILTEQFKYLTGTNLIHVPYKSSAVARTDLISGQVDLMIDGMATMKPFVENGRIRALGVTSAGRNPNMPNVPPVVEAVQGFVEEAWVGMMAPAGTPQVAVDRFSAEIIKILAMPEVRKFYADQGTISQGSTPAAFGAVIKADIDKWAQVIKIAQVRAD